jgi:hypothetical protein
MKGERLLIGVRRPIAIAGAAEYVSAGRFDVAGDALRSKMITSGHQLECLEADAHGASIHIIRNFRPHTCIKRSHILCVAFFVVPYALLIDAAKHSGHTMLLVDSCARKDW